LIRGLLYHGKGRELRENKRGKHGRKVEEKVEQDSTKRKEMKIRKEN